MADGGTITAADTGSPADNSDSGIDPVTGQPQTQGFKAWFKQHETLSLVIGAGVLLLTAILVFRKNQSATPSGDLSGQATDTSGQTDNSGALAAAINALLNYLGSHSGDQNPPPSPAPPAPVAPPVPPVPHPPPGPMPIQPIPIRGRPEPGPGPGPHRKPPPGPPVPPGRKPPPPGPQPPVPPGRGGTGDIVDGADYATVAQWTPDSAPIQQSFSNITQGETSAITRIESLFAGLGDGVYQGGVNVPYPGPEPTGFPRSPWQPIPVGVPGSPLPPVPISPASGPGQGPPGGMPSSPGVGPPSGPTSPGVGPPSGPGGPGQGPPQGRRFPRMPWQPV